MVRLFISHCSRDKELAKRVADLLRVACGLKSQEIRCSSVDGYRLAGGADTDENLRTEIVSADSLVGLVSASSVDSAYVLFELGARWGAKRSIVPLLAPGATASILPSPLSATNALDSSNRSQLMQFVTDVARELGVDAEPPSSFIDHVDGILGLPTTARSATKEPREVPRREQDAPSLRPSTLRCCAS